MSVVQCPRCGLKVDATRSAGIVCPRCLVRGHGRFEMAPEGAAIPRHVESFPHEERWIIRGHGEFDAGSCDDLITALRQGLDSRAVEVSVDLTGATFIDCRALAEILRANRLLSQRGGTLHVAVRETQPRRLLELTGVADTVDVRAGARPAAQRRSQAAPQRRSLRQSRSAAPPRHATPG